MSSAPIHPRISDALGRPLRDLRISLTDRCNFRCTYCMPRNIFGPNHLFLPESQLLSFSEIIRLASFFARLGVSKLRLTGGEPLLRPNLTNLIPQLAAIDGIDDIALTTNGTLLDKLSANLKQAGLHRLTVSLDALDPDLFQSISDTQVPLQTVLNGIRTAHNAGFSPIKINAVIQRNLNESQILPLAQQFTQPGFILRYIEYMDVGNSNGWKLNQVVPASEILEILSRHFTLDPLPLHCQSDTARRYQIRETGGEFGIIASVSAPFCGQCSRARLSADGQLHTCLFSPPTLDLRGLLRSGASDSVLLEAIADCWNRRTDRYSEIRASLSRPHPKTEMSVLGG